MSLSMTPGPGPVSAPWFRRQRRLTLAVAGILVAGIFALRVLVGDADDVVSMLYALPISLVAIAFGLRPGLAAGLVCVGLVAVWAEVDGVSLSILGWTARVLPLLLLGALVGHASDQLGRAEQERLAMEAAAQRHRNAIEINDTLIQGMAAARWSLESGGEGRGRETALRTLAETIDTGHRLVSELLRDAGMGLDGHRPPPRTGGADRIEP